MDKKVLLIKTMISYYADDPCRIQHFMKVHNFAHVIGKLENLGDEEQHILETAAIVHDIGIKVSEEKYGDADGKHQELEGPVIAGAMLKNLGFKDSIIDRVCYLIAHHHTYSDISGLDYQILVEADFLVNLYEGNESKETAGQVLRRIFRTESGRQICADMFGLSLKREVTQE